MRRTSSILVLLLVTCAVVVKLLYREEAKVSPFSIAGVSLGMGRQQVIDKLGQPGHQSQQSMWYDLEWHEVEVRMNDGGQVIGVSGTRLELGEVDYTPEKPHGELSPDLVTFLGGEGWKLARRDFSHDWNDEEFQLTIQFGCTGWYFFLGERTG